MPLDEAVEGPRIHHQWLPDVIEIEAEAEALYEQDPALAEAFLTKYVHDLANSTVERYWRLGDELWTRFNRLF